MSMGRTMEAIVWAMSARGISVGAWKLLVILARRVGTRNFDVWPKHKTIANDAEMSVSSVRRYLAELEEHGYIKIVPRFDEAGDRTSNAYQLQVRVKIVTPTESHEIEPDFEAEDLDGGPVKLSRPPVQSGGTGLFTGEQAEEIPDGRNSSGRAPSLPSEERSPGGEDLFPGSIPDALHDFVEKRWHELKAKFPGVADVRKIDDGLRHTIEMRARQHAQRGQSEHQVWEEFFEIVAGSTFLTGRAPPGPGRDSPFKLSLPWAVKAQNFREIIGGKYNGERDHNQFDGATGRKLGPTSQALRGSVARLRDAQGRAPGRGDFGGDQHRASR